MNLGLVSEHCNTIFAHFYRLLPCCFYIFRLQKPISTIHIALVSPSLRRTSAPIQFTIVLGVLGPQETTCSISSTLSLPRSCVDEIDRYCLKTLTEDFLNFLNPISSVILSFACLSCFHATCALCMFHFIMMTMLLLCYAWT